MPYPWASSQRPTAAALRRLAATTVFSVPTTAAAMVDPLGDGITRRGVTGAVRNTAGDRDHGCSADTSRRRTTSRASCSAANACAPGSSQRRGKTAIPRPVTTVTAVVNDRTSITTTQAPPPAR